MNQTPIERADHILMNIRLHTATINQLKNRMNDEIDKITIQYKGHYDSIVKQVEEFEKELEKIVKSKKDGIMNGNDRLDLSHGSVMLKVERRVKQIKGMLEKLKEAGLNQAVKVSKEIVDWDMVEKFDDLTLSKLGTCRKEKKHFSYELKGA